MSRVGQPPSPAMPVGEGWGEGSFASKLRSRLNPLPRVMWERGVNIPSLTAAFLATGCLALAVYVGSAQLRHLDLALSGYLAATFVACFATTYRVAAFWSRPTSAFFGCILLASLWRPRDAATGAAAMARDVIAQDFVRRRGIARWFAHMLMSWGTLVAFAVTLPLVWGWMRFEVAGEREYVALFAGITTVRFAADSLVGWMTFHVLSVCAAAVIAGCTYFLWQRLRGGGVARDHVAPLLLLVAVAATGLLLVPAARVPSTWVFPVAQIAHQICVVVLLIALSFSKLIHIFIRPLHVGVQVLRATADESTCCRSCSAPIVPVAQFASVESTLAGRGMHFAGYQGLCPACRRRNLAVQHTALLRSGVRNG